MTVDEATVEAIARRVVELLEAPAPTEWLTPAEAATKFGKSAWWVRKHADALGAKRVGDGPRPRLLIPANAVAPEKPAPTPPAPLPRRQRQPRRTYAPPSAPLPRRGRA